MVFDGRWIDAEVRRGKVGGAFCMDVPAVKESRILRNFDGTLDQVSTVAHELGQAFHNECAFAAGKTMLEQDTPMTLAETASIMCETVARAQGATYGDGLDERYRQPWMWTWKPHYYSPELAFYDYPFAFGLLLGAGLYAVYRERGAAFVPESMAFLASTGEAPAAELAARFGIDIRSRRFWDRSLEVIAGQIDRTCAPPWRERCSHDACPRGKGWATMGHARRLPRLPAQRRDDRRLPGHDRRARRARAGPPLGLEGRVPGRLP